MITTELIQKYFGTLEEFERFRLRLYCIDNDREA